MGFGDGTDRSLGRWLWLEFGSVSDRLHDCLVAGLKFGGGFQWLRLEFAGGFR